MACGWRLPEKSPYWFAQYRSADGRRMNRSTKQTDRRRAQKIANKWEAAAKKARSSELTQAASVKILAELMEITTSDTLHVREKVTEGQAKITTLVCVAIS